MRADEKSHHGDALDDAFAVVAEVLLGKDRKKRVVVTHAERCGRGGMVMGGSGSWHHTLPLSKVGKTIHGASDVGRETAPGSTAAPH